MSRLPLLPKWVLTTPFPSAYDIVSATPIEMVAKVYGAMNQLIEEYNSFVDTYNDEIRSFTSSSNEEIANFKQSMEQRLQCKFNELDVLFAKLRLEMKQYTDTTLEKALDIFGVNVKTTGENIILSDATDEKIRALSIYGKTTQQRAPTPESPADLQSVGDPGSVTVTITNGTDKQLLTVATPEGLPGIPVTDGGNYTDPTGQAWICDEIDLKRGVYVSRINRVNLATLAGWRHDAGWANANAFFTTELPENIKAVSDFFTIANIVSNRFPVATPNTISKTATAAIGQSGIGVYVSAPGVTSVEALENFFSSNETVMQYAMETPTERPLTAAELATYKKLHTYMPDTTISNGSGAGMFVEYVAITQKYLENRIHEQAALITTQKINEAIKNGDIVVGLEYNEETEQANIVVGGEV